MNNSLKALVPIVLIFGLVLVLLGGFIVIVDAGHVGVVKRLGAIQEKALPEGMHFKRPFMDVVEQIDVRLTPSHAKSTAASKDLQTVSTEVTVAYSLQADLAPQAYQRIGDRGKIAVALVEPAIQESVKAVTAKFTAEELVTKRELVKQQIQQALELFIANTLKQKELDGAIVIANVAITDFNFSNEFNRAIELKVQAEQQALQARNEKIKRVTQAEAAAAERQLAADAEAYSTEVQSKARADAIRREAEALKQSPELIQLRTVEKWDGVLPRVNGAGAIPLLNLGDAGTDLSKPAVAR
jgi:regulator of protease activity HflC (stomatin/prohibitin superfamily)